MTCFEERAIVHYRITLSQEGVPKRGDVLHACGLTNWHAVVRRMIKKFPPNEDGTMDIKMSVVRSDIGKENRPCPICGEAWMVNTPQAEAKKAEQSVS